jgi:hypothetical protein
MMYLMHFVCLYNITGGVSKTTRYYDNKRIGIPIDTPVSIGGDWYGEPQRDFYCEYCQRRLLKLQNNTGNFSYYCNACSITTNPDEKEMRSKGKLETMPGPPNTPLATTKFKELTLGRKKTEVRGGLAELQRRGMKITSYSESNVRRERNND